MKEMKQQIFDIISDHDSLVDFDKGREHCILPEHYDELADEINNLVKRECKKFAEYCGESFIKLHGGFMPKFLDQRKPENLISTDKMYSNYLTQSTFTDEKR